MVFPERAQHGAPGGDVEVVRAVVAHEHRVAAEVDRMELREGAADLQPVEDHHRDAVLEVELAAHREAGRREEGVADDEVGDELARLGARLPLVVVGETVEGALFDEALQRHGGAGRHVEVVLGELLGPGVGDGIRSVEEAEDAGLHLRNLGLRR